MVAAVWAVVTGGLGTMTLAAAEAVAAPGPARVEDAVVLVFGSAGLAVGWWLAVATLASVVAAVLAGRRPGGMLARAASGVARRTAPVALRRAVVLAAGLSLAGVAAPATALPRTGSAAAGAAVSAPAAACRTPDPVGPRATGLDPSWSATTPGTQPAARLAADRDLDPGWVPEPPPRTAARVAQTRMPGPAPRARHAARSEVVVRRGDSLWTIVERYLGPSATAAEVAAEWPRWHAANREVVGPDPDVLEPGQVLRPPGTAAARDRVRPLVPACDGDEVTVR